MTQQQIIPQLIVGLGNPGAKYERTRHNIGFDLLDHLADRWQVSWQENKRFQGLVSEKISIGGDKVYLLKPLTYMNKSGQAIRAVVDWYKLPPESVLLVYDDLDLPVGRLRLRLTGSAGGHNGVKSAIAHLGTQSFPRVRIGIGKSYAEKETISHVLTKFSPDERDIIDQVIPLGVEAIEVSLREGVEKAMNLYNSVNIEGKK
jgi:PTH1 family peptidyl-tRNA hydrolase